MGHPRILTIDIGTGTQDILVFEAGTVVENSIQLIMPSPTMLIAERVRRATLDGAELLLTGVTMGGGPAHWAIEAHLRQGLRVYATPDAARTFDDDLTRVEAMGVRVIDEGTLAHLPRAQRLELRDFSFAAVADALAAFGVPADVDAVCVAVFDHGAAPPEVSDRRFRFEYLKEQVQRGARLEGFGFLQPEIPSRMTRMQAVARSWTGDALLFVMDTGPAAVLGALDDPRVRAAGRSLLLNLGNFHAIAVLMDEAKICGLFEHHTGELSRGKLEAYLDQLANGTLRNEAVFDDMGHGALELGPQGFAPALLVVTGPRRGMLADSRWNPYLAVPHGDMMLTGCFGLLRGLANHLPEYAAAIERELGPPAFRSG